ncbi:hypothetical protein MYAER_1298 [Microcystis aeruginosa NIES-2549]|uniref:Uncharacterized protein n=1 Tax=Microcystis aeruginosa NIES-2549 TaxID=1641812 RepID=A0A0F6U2E9_MICAE|nr:hypothetical protein MYAER_1298 [Microcystis aeruginosa NIES-2549]AOC52045.1 hypothetical protein amyaer_1310 [Microcystis aeruginosa NIES-2481]
MTEVEKSGIHRQAMIFCRLESVDRESGTGKGQYSSLIWLNNQ